MKPMKPTKLKKMKLKSVDFVKRGANQEAHIMLRKSADDGVVTDNEDEKSFFKSLSDTVAGAIKKAFKLDLEHDYMDVRKAENDLTMFTDVLGESFSSIMKDDTLDHSDRIEMVEKSVSEFIDTLDGYLSSFDSLEKSSYYTDEFQTAVTNKSSNYLRKGEDVTMRIYDDVDKSLLSAEEQFMLDSLIAKATPTNEEDYPAGKVNPAKAQEEEEDNLPPAVKKALEEVEEMKKSYEMKELTSIAKKYECLGKKASEEAETLYNLKKSGEANYNAYVAALDAQVDMVEKSGMFAEIGKSGAYNYSSLAKSEPESKVEAIAKGYMEKDPTLDYNDAVAKAWENNPDLMAAYDSEFLG